MKTTQERANLARHGLRLNTPAPRVEPIKKYPTRAQMRQEVRRVPLGLPAAEYAEE